MVAPIIVQLKRIIFVMVHQVYVIVNKVMTKMRKVNVYQQLIVEMEILKALKNVMMEIQYQVIF